MLTHGIYQNSLVVWSSPYLITCSFQEHVKLTTMVNTAFTQVSGQGAIAPTINVRTFSNMSITGYLAGRPDGNMITRKIRKPVPEDSLVSQEIDEIETGQTEARVSFDKDTELSSNSSRDQLILDEHERRRSVKSAERISSVT